MVLNFKNLKMKKALKICLVFICLSFSANAQDVSHKDIDFKSKKGFVIVNDQNVFKLKSSGAYFYLYDLNTGDEIMYIYFNNNETQGYIEDDYVKVYFTKSKNSFESNSFYKTIMANLINEKIFTTDWILDEDKIDDFIVKYDENITNRTTR